MKKYLKEIILFILYICLFYLFPLTAGPTDEMGLIILPTNNPTYVIAI